MAYSKDFRLKVLAVMDRGERQEAVARRFDIGVRTVRRFKQRRRQTGEVATRKTGPRGPIKLTPNDDEVMREQVRLKPGVTAQEIVPMLSVNVVISTVCRRLIKLGLSLKKNVDRRRTEACRCGGATP